MSSWKNWIEEMWPACPGLESYDDKGFKDDLHRSVLAFIGRLLKEGHSSFIATQAMDDMQWLDLVNFFHLIRWDAVNQQIIGSYLNASVFEKKTLLIIGDEYRFKNILLDKKGEEPHCANVFPRATRASQIETFELKGEFFNTLITGKRMMSLEKIEALSLHLNPFVILFDVTQNGFRQELSEYWDYFNCYFPNTPKFAIGTSGDVMTQGLAETLDTHKINFRLGDLQTFHNPPKRTTCSIQCLFSEDQFFISTMNRVIKILYDLKKSDTEEDRELRSITYKILNLFENCVVPLNYLELELQKAARRGPFPISSIDFQIKNLKRKEFRYRSTQQKCDEIIALFDEYTDALEINGKTSLLKNYVSRQLEKKKNLVILVDTRHQCKALFNYFSAEKIDFTDRVRIIYKSIKPYKEMIDSGYDELIITSRLWDSDLVWLSLPVKKITFIAHSNEEKRLDFGFQRFNQKINGVSINDGDKLHLLEYEFDDEYLSDGQIEDDVQLPIKKKTDKKSTGLYTHYSHSEITIDFDQSYLFEEMEDLLEGKEDDVIDKDYDQIVCEVIIKVEDRDHLICLNPDSYAQIIDSSSDHPLQQVKAEELEIGQNLVLINGEDPKRSNLLDIIFEEFTRSKEFLLSYQLSKQWDDLVDTAAIKFQTARPIHKAMQKILKKTPSVQTIQTWLSHMRLGPRDKEAFVALAQICNHHAALNSTEVILKAIAKTRSVRQQIGKAINESLRSDLSDEHTFTISGCHISNEILRDLISVSKIVDITVPKREVIKKRSNMKDLISWINKNYSEQIILTNTCKKSMEDSPYEDIEKAELCFTLLATTFISHFEGNIRLHDLLAQLKKDDIDYARGTSESTKGKTGDYNCAYNGHAFSVDKHLRVGTAYDPKYTLRIYFEWLKKEQKILVCHAGRHKKT